MSADFLAQQRRRRDKLQLSCNICRKRKVRCDRNQPCKNCVARGEHAHCSYATIPIANSHRLNSVRSQLGLSDTLAQEKDTTSSDNAPSIASSVGRIQVTGNETNYVGGEHWAVLADTILGGQQTREQQSSRWPDLLLGLREGSTVKQLLASVPPKAEVDRLISKYFNSLDLAAWVSHGPIFEEEYERFWKDPSTASLNWLSMLFSMLCLATELMLQSGQSLPANEGKAQENVILYRRCSAQCLMLSDYTKPTTYTVEALVLYFYSEYLRCEDTHFGLDVVLATIVRVAMRMGYHRDPSHYPNISIFVGEMRRRLWAIVIQLDILVSLQIGLPRMINERDCDTQSPRNVLPEEMDPDMTVLPPSRPESAGAVVTYIRAKTRMVIALGRIHGHVTSVQPSPYETVVQLHEMLCAQHEALPTCLKMRDSAPVTDSPTVVMRRLCLDLLFQRSRCLLHRRYMRPQNRLSWETCLDAALAITRHQSYVYRETQPGGLFVGQLWKLTHMATYDFLLASMLLCLGLRHGSASKTCSTSGRRIEVLSALEEALSIWVKWCTEGKRSRRVLDIVSPMMDRVKSDAASSTREHTAQDIAPVMGLNVEATPGNLAFTLSASDAAQTEAENNTGISSPSLLDPMEHFDWASWDTSLQENGIYLQLSSNDRVF